MTFLALVTLVFLQDGGEFEKRYGELLKKVTPSVARLASESTPTSFPYYVRTDEGSIVYTAKALAKLAEGYPSTVRALKIAGEVDRDPGIYLPRVSFAPKLRASKTRIPGFFVDAKGSFVTTAEAVKHALHPLKVTLQDGKTVTLKLVTSDVGLAVLKVDPEQATEPLKFGDSAKIEPGMTVTVVSFAGNSPVLRKAMVIGRERKALSTPTLEAFIHLDYPALESEVGSPVLNSNGELIGILADAIFEHTGWGTDGATVPRRAIVIPVTTLKAFLDKRDAQGAFQRGFLGVELEAVDGGVKVVQVLPGSPADKAGIHVGDAISQIGSTPVKDEYDVACLTCFAAGEKIQVTATRNGAIHLFSVMIGSLTDQKAIQEKQHSLKDRIGLEVVDLTDDLRKFLELPNLKGVVIQQVVPGSVAEQAGLRRGDAIVSADNAAVETAAALAEKVQSLAGDAYLVLESWRAGKKVPVVLKVK